MKRAYATAAQDIGVDDRSPASAEWNEVRELVPDYARLHRGSAADWWPTLEAAFADIESECASPNWDGEESLPVSPPTVMMAKWIANSLYWLLPRGTPPPDAVGESDGEICLSWEIDVDRYFILSVGALGNLSFTGRFGAGGGQHGWRQLDATALHSSRRPLQDLAQLVARAYELDAIRGST